MTAASNSEARKRAAEAASAKVAADAHPRFWAQFIAEHFPSAKRDAPLVTCDCGWAEAFDDTGADWPDHVARELARALAEDVAVSNSESPLSQPIPAPVDSGAIGRLNEAERASCDGSGRCSASRHIHGCFADMDGSTCDDPVDHAAASCPTGCISCQMAGRCWDCPCHSDSEPTVERLNEAVRSVLIEAFAREMYERVMEATADQWRRWPFLTDTAKEAYRVEAAEVMTDALGPAVERIVREHTDRALAEVEQRIAAIPFSAAPSFNTGRNAALTIVRAARQEQGRG